MLFDGQELRDGIAGTTTPIELRNEYGRCCRTVSRDEAGVLDLDLFVGVGNRRGIRFLRLYWPGPLALSVQSASPCASTRSRCDSTS